MTKKFVMIAAVAALSACNDNKAETAPAASESAPPPAAGTASAPAERAGTYTYTLADGTTGTTVLAADGTYTDSGTDLAQAEAGTWSIDPAGRVCFDPQGDDPGQPSRCYVMSEPDADGTMTATDDDGQVVKVKKTA
jgi:hypothetical protein